MDSIGLLNKIFNNIVSSDLQRSLLPVKLILILISLIIIVLIVWLFMKSSYKNFLFLDLWNDRKLLKSIRADGLDEKEGVITEKIEEIKDESQIRSQSEKQSQPQQPSQPLPQEDNEKDFIEIKKKEMGKIETSDWQRIIDKIGTKDGLKCKLSLLDADRLLDKSLIEKSKSLSDLGNFEKMQKIKDYLEHLLEHPKKGISFKNANNIIREYKIALKELGVI